MKKIVIAVVIVIIVVVGFIIAKGVFTNDKKIQNDSNDKLSVEKAVPKIAVEENPIATITMKDYGTMTFELYANEAPESVYNFIELANKGFYNGLIMHRLIENFVIQGGDPEGTGIGGPGYSIKGEFPSNGVKEALPHDIGVLAMARSTMPDSAGSQFYIVTGESGKAPNMTNDYAAFGKIITGMDVLEKLNKVETDQSDKPIENVVIDSIKIDTKGVEYPSPEKIGEKKAQN